MMMPARHEKARMTEGREGREGQVGLEGCAFLPHAMNAQPSRARKVSAAMCEGLPMWKRWAVWKVSCSGFPAFI